MGGMRYQKRLSDPGLFQNTIPWKGPVLSNRRRFVPAGCWSRFSFLWIFLCALSGVWAADIRTIPMNINVILDGSRGMGAYRGEAAAWLCDYLAEGVLIEGDRLNIWIAGEKARRVYSGFLGGQWKEGVKTIFRSFVTDSRQADLAGALGEASRFSGGQGGDIPAYTILVCASSRGLASLEREGAAYLRYSRNREFAGWRVVTVALDTGPEIREAVRAYLVAG
jgi:hypothetical protein